MTDRKVSSGLLSLDTTVPHDYEPDLPDSVATWSLEEIAYSYGSDKSRIKHNYTHIYENFLSRKRNENIKLLEIGVACGASLKTWARYFPNGKVLGLDINPECQALCKSYENIEIRICNATTDLVDGLFDIIIDDGSHVGDDILKTFKLYWSSLLPGGLYFIEDLSCTYNGPYLLEHGVERENIIQSRKSILLLLDFLTKSIDAKGGNQNRIANFFYSKELLVIQKLP